MINRLPTLVLTVIFASLCATSSTAFGQETADTIRRNRSNLHFQTTYIYQYKPAYSAKYSGENSLSTKEDKENSVTATLYLGARLWKGAELYINPEIAGGSGLSGAYGLAASTNGETFRVGDPAPTLYLARGFLKQSFALNCKAEAATEGANQVATSYCSHSLSFYIGKFSLGDLFDNNTVSTGPRTGFMNWCLMNNGAWDYAANLRGYTYSFTTVLQWDNMQYKAALATMPVVANGGDLNTNLNEEYSLNAEVTRSYKLNSKDGHIRLLGYYNNGNMGNYNQAIVQSANGLDQPNVIATRKYGRTKVGAGLNFDQQLGKSTSIFARAGWSDGKNETWCFTEADQSISGGINLNGALWSRKDDNIGAAVVVNGLSKDHRTYLADGGLGFQLGDGHISYANETATELYYNFKPTSNGIWLSADYQLILNPGYNTDRGPVNVFSFRLHVEL